MPLFCVLFSGGLCIRACNYHYDPRKFELSLTGGPSRAVRRASHTTLFVFFLLPDDALIRTTVVPVCLPGPCIFWVLGWWCRVGSYSQDSNIVLFLYYPFCTCFVSIAKLKDNCQFTMT